MDAVTLMNSEYARLVPDFYRSLYRIRRVEEEIARIYPTDRIKSPIHLSIGQEAVSVAVCGVLRQGDVVFGSYRGHAMYLAKGGDLKKMIAELYGKETGCARGKGGSMHLVDAAAGVMGTSAVVATTVPLSAGYAFALKKRGGGSIVASFFGDGAVDEGAFHESMNFAALKKLPVLFVCENNEYAIHSHHMSRHHTDNLRERAVTYGMPAERVEDGDIFEMYRVAGELAGGVRNGDGPAFIECRTCRWTEHVGPGDDFHLGYRSEEEVRPWKENDQMIRLRRLMPEAEAKAVESEVERGISEAFAFAEESGFPPPEALHEDVFKGR